MDTMDKEYELADIEPQLGKNRCDACNEYENYDLMEDCHYCGTTLCRSCQTKIMDETYCGIECFDMEWQEKHTKALQKLGDYGITLSLIREQYEHLKAHKPQLADYVFFAEYVGRQIEHWKHQGGK